MVKPTPVLENRRTIKRSGDLQDGKFPEASEEKERQDDQKGTGYKEQTQTGGPEAPGFSAQGEPHRPLLLRHQDRCEADKSLSPAFRAALVSRGDCVLRLSCPSLVFGGTREGRGMDANTVKDMGGHRSDTPWFQRK